MIRVYIGSDCTPCQEVADLVKQGKTAEPVELVDVETDEGFALFMAEIQGKEEGGVPSAYKAGKQCEIFMDEETRQLLFQCPPDDSPASPPG